MILVLYDYGLLKTWKSSCSFDGIWITFNTLLICFYLTNAWKRNPFPQISIALTCMYKRWLQLSCFCCFQKYYCSNNEVCWDFWNIVGNFETRCEICWLLRSFSLKLNIPIFLHLEVHLYAPKISPSSSASVCWLQLNDNLHTSPYLYIGLFRLCSSHIVSSNVKTSRITKITLPLFVTYIYLDWITNCNQLFG